MQGKFPIYFVAGCSSKGLLEDSLIEELAQRNIHFSRPFGVSKTSEGLRFAFISGAEEKRIGSADIQIKNSDLEFVEEQYLISEEGEGEGVIDLLFSWSWPSSIISGNNSLPVSKSLSSLMFRLKPRYIFCPSHSDDFHFERAPFENIDSKTGEFLHATRFISLANCLNQKQKKWIYALNLEPAKHASFLTLGKRPDDCTTNPLSPSLQKPASETSVSKAQNYFFQVPHDAVVGSKRRLEESAASAEPLKRPPSGYVCKKCRSGDHFFRDCPHQDSKYGTEKKSYVCHICHEPGHKILDCPKKEEHRQGRQNSSSITPETCWFCLSNPASRKYLIFDIGEEVYLTLAKGPLTPEHSLIIPIEHIPSNTGILSDPVKEEVQLLMVRIGSALLKVKKVPIFFRLCHNPSHHYHIQMIPIDQDKLPEFLKFLKEYSEKLEFKFNESTFVLPSFDFMFFQEKQKITTLSHSFDQESFFPAQFGRQVLAAFLDVSEQADWKAQTYSEAEEKKFVIDLKKLFSTEQ